MSLYKPFILVVFLLLAGCGFQPLYGNYSAAKVNHAELQQVRLAGVISRESTTVNSVQIGERLNQQLTNKLIDRMYKTGYPKQPLFDLTLEMKAVERETGIQKDATATRAELMVTAEMILHEAKTQQELYRSTARTRVAYNILAGQYGTLVAKENAYDRAMDDLASDIVTRLSLYLNRDKAGVSQ